MTRPYKADGSYDEETHLEYLRGTYDQNPLSKAKLESSLKHLEAAVESNPRFTRALNELAYTKVVAAISGWFPQRAQQLLREAKEHSLETLRRDGHHDYAVHWTRGFYLTNTGDSHDFDEGLTEFAKAEELFRTHTDPMDRRSGLLMEYGETLVYAGRVSEGLEKIKKAMTLPDWYYWVAAFAYHMNGDHQEALDHLDKMKAKPGDPGFLFPTLLLRAAILEELGNREDATAALVEFASVEPYVAGERVSTDAAGVPESVKEMALSNELDGCGFKEDNEMSAELNMRFTRALKRALQRAEKQMKDAGFDESAPQKPTP